MGRILVISVSIVLLIVFAVFVPNSIAEPTGRGKEPTRRGKLRFNEKDLWGNVVPKGANGELKYNLEGPNFDFEFKAKGLESNKDYAIIRSLEPETNMPYWFENIEEGTSDNRGMLVIKSSYNFDIDLISAEFLLVPLEMLDLLINGRPSPSGRYLSGQGLIKYNDTDTELKCGCQASGTSFDEVGIPIGEEAVDFTLIDTTDDEFALYEFLGNENKPVVLIFGAYT